MGAEIEGDDRIVDVELSMWYRERVETAIPRFCLIPGEPQTDDE